MDSVIDENVPSLFSESMQFVNIRCEHISQAHKNKSDTQVANRLGELKKVNIW